jgi:hypothetical protein
VPIELGAAAFHDLPGALGVSQVASAGLLVDLLIWA